MILAAGSIGTTKLLVRARERGDLPALNAHVATRWSSNGNANSFRIISDSVAPQGGPAGVKIVNYDDPTNPVVFENLPQRVPPFFANDAQLAPFVGALLNIGLGIPSETGHFSYEPATVRSRRLARARRGSGDEPLGADLGAGPALLGSHRHPDQTRLARPRVSRHQVDRTAPGSAVHLFSSSMFMNARAD